MAKQNIQDGTPVIGEEGNFFADFMPDEDSGLLIEPIQPPEGETKEEEEEDEIEEEEEDDNLEDEEIEEEEEEEELEDEVETSESNTSENLTTTMTSFVEKGVLDIVDENKEYSPDSSGFQELINDTVQNRLEAKISEREESRREEVRELETYLETYPEATVEDFLNDQEEFDYNTVDDSDPKSQIYLLQDAYEAQGYSKEEIIATIKEHQAANSIARHAKKAKAFLVKEQEAAIQVKAQAREQAKAQREAELTENRRKFEQQVLKTESIGGIPIKPEERQKLADYILKPVDDSGKSQAEIDTDNRDAELLLAYLKMNKINLKKLVTDSETKATIKFKKKLDNFTDKNATPRKSKKQPNVVAEPDDLSGLDDWQM